MTLLPVALSGRCRALPGGVWRLLSLQFLMSASHFMVAPVLALHLADGLGFTAGRLGTVLSIHLMSAKVLPVVTGPLADRYGPRSLMTAGLAARALGLLAFAITGNWLLLCGAALLMGLGTAAYECAVYGAIARHPRDTATRVFVLNNQALNLGVIAGPALGAGLLLIDAATVFAASALMFASLAFATRALGDLGACSSTGSVVRASLTAATAHKSLRCLLVVALPWWFLFSQLYVVFPIHAVRLAGSETGASLVFLANGLAGSVFAVFGLHVFERLRSCTVIVWCYAGLVPAYLLVAATAGMSWFLAFVCLYTLAETLILPALRSTVAELAPAGHESTFQGMLSLSWAAAGGLGNYAGGWLVIEHIGSLTWLLFSGCAAMGAGLALWFRSRQLGTSGTGAVSLMRTSLR